MGLHIISAQHLYIASGKLQKKTQSYGFSILYVSFLNKVFYYLRTTCV